MRHFKAVLMTVAIAAFMVTRATAQDLASFDKRVSVRKLSNGLTLLVLERPEAPVFSFFTFVDAGSAQDPKGATGLAHMFEHMAFKGTENIGTTDYGKASDFDQPLSKYGTVQTIDIKTPELNTEPAAGSSVPAQSSGAEGNSPEATEFFEKVVEGLGGRQNVTAVKSLMEKASLSLQKPQPMELTTEQTVVLPDTLRQTMSMAMGSMTMVVTPLTSWISTPGGVHDLPSSQRDSALRDIDESPWVMAQRAGTSKLTLAIAGQEKLGGVDTKILAVSGSGIRPVKWYVDPASGRILRSSMQVAELGETGDKVTDFSDFRTVAGVVFPFKQTVSINGRIFGSVQTTELQVNMPVDPALFERPAK
ncbi:MAG TPA: insulinase family protein [Thermoanaerobaculia bacterium]|nr:insulinase family protein [Thermoanaerobaculia bacterium]